MMEQQRFDTLARTMAGPQPQPRRFGSRLLGFGLGAVALATAARRPQPAAAEVCEQRVPRPGFTPTSNGCGAEDGLKVPDRVWGANFKPSCDAHDICYSTCNSSKETCDTDFLLGNVQACVDAGYTGLALAGCKAIAGDYYLAVDLLGDDPYESAQKEACYCCNPGSTACGDPPAACCHADETCCDGTCCPDGQECCDGTCCPEGLECCGDGTCKERCGSGQKVYCNCNKQCYTSATSCLAECRTSLGCYTGICDPAEPGQCD
jgi:hypothetical protein